MFFAFLPPGVHFRPPHAISAADRAPSFLPRRLSLLIATARSCLSSLPVPLIVVASTGAPCLFSDEGPSRIVSKSQPFQGGRPRLQARCLCRQDW